MSAELNFLTVSAAEVQRKFGYYSDEAMLQPVGIQRHGTTRLVMISAAEYERLKRRDRQSILSKDLSDDLIRQIEQSEPSEASKALNHLMEAP
jgi:PHD/YefM family antitoxin component YafN of YafNO toxin-antitoxin module